MINIGSLSITPGETFDRFTKVIGLSRDIDWNVECIVQNKNGRNFTPFTITMSKSSTYLLDGGYDLSFYASSETTKTYVEAGNALIIQIIFKNKYDTDPVIISEPTTIYINYIKGYY